MRVTFFWFVLSPLSPSVEPEDCVFSGSPTVYAELAIRLSAQGLSIADMAPAFYVGPAAREEANADAKRRVDHVRRAVAGVHRV